jgi:hypothetical protein
MTEAKLCSGCKVTPLPEGADHYLCEGCADEAKPASSICHEESEMKPTSVGKFVKLPVEIEAIQFTDESKDRCFNFITCNHYSDFDDDGTPILRIQTLEGMMVAAFGDWIIKGVAGEFYPCKPDIFDKTYEAVEPTEEDITDCTCHRDVLNCPVHSLETG